MNAYLQFVGMGMGREEMRREGKGKEGREGGLLLRGGEGRGGKGEGGKGEDGRGGGGELEAPLCEILNMPQVDGLVHL